MAKALVQCPATDTMELIEYVDTPLGALIHACSRFRPATAMACGRGCARGRHCTLEESSADFEVETSFDDTELDVDACPRDDTSPTVVD